MLNWSFEGLGIMFPNKEYLKATECNDILDNSVFPALWGGSQDDNAAVCKVKAICVTVCKNLTWLHWVPTSTSSNSAGISWNATCEPDISANDPVAEWKQVSTFRVDGPFQSPHTSEIHNSVYL